MGDSRRALTVAAVCWLAVTAAWVWWPVEHGLRAQYFSNPDWVAPPILTRVDPILSTGTVYNAWRTEPPSQFSVQWSGFLDVPDGASRTLALEADDALRLYVDGELLIDTTGPGSPTTGLALLEPGSHRIVVHYTQRGDAYEIEWSWSEEGGAQEPVPSWALTPRQPGVTASTTRWLAPIWWTVTTLVAFLLAIVGTQRAGVWRTRRLASAFVARLVAFLLLGWLLVAGASQHERAMNYFSARGDQSGYLWDAQVIYGNWNGRTPPLLVGERMRMPLYAGFLALGYSPHLTSDEFFELAKTWNLRLAVALLAALAIFFAWRLPPLLSFNLTLVIGFGFWSFKAPYAQPELLFYFFFFGTFVACAHLFRPHRPLVDLGLGVLAGVLAGLAFLTKALVPPFVGLFLATYGANELVGAWRGWRSKDETLRRRALVQFAWRAAAGAAMAAAFSAVVWPYVSNSRRVFGQYFYNANTTYFMWYDDGADARAIMMPHIDVEGRVSMPPEQLPGLEQYLRTRTPGQIAARLADGFQNIVARSYDSYWYFYSVVAYLALATAVIARNWKAFVALLREHWALAAFLVAYTGVYLAGTAFFSITSSTGTTRFFITHLTPLLFTLSCLFAKKPFSDSTWTIGPAVLRLHHVHLAILSAMGIGLAPFWWPRMMTTYGGF